jgi:transposase InsO family protein
VIKFALKGGVLNPLANKKPIKVDEYAEEVINSVYHTHKGTYGRDRITLAIQNAGIKINHKKVYRIMRKLGLKAIVRKKWSIRKYIKENLAENTLNRNFKSDEPLKKLVCDVTELKRVNDKRYYMFSIIDLYNNAIIAFNLSSHNDWALVLNALWKLPQQTEGTTLHSDQGA